MCSVSQCLNGLHREESETWVHNPLDHQSRVFGTEPWAPVSWMTGRILHSKTSEVIHSTAGVANLRSGGQMQPSMSLCLAVITLPRLYPSHTLQCFADEYRDILFHHHQHQCHQNFTIYTSPIWLGCPNYFRKALPYIQKLPYRHTNNTAVSSTVWAEIGWGKCPDVWQLTSAVAFLPIFHKNSSKTAILQK